MKKYGFTIVFVIVALINLGVAVYQFTHNDITLGAVNTATVALASYLAYITLPEKETIYVKESNRPIIETQDNQNNIVTELPLKTEIRSKNANKVKTRNSRVTSLLVSSIMTVIYIGILIYIVYDVTNIKSTGDSAYDLGTAIGASLGVMLLYPHMAFVFISFIFNVVAYVWNLSWSALVAAILYIVAMVLMPTYFFGILVQMILCFIGYSKLKKTNI
ncbi:glycerol-3-phosphate acyltransferase [Erysipelothrix sp. HDW6A]|uniref:glycerol-3-phosphate acyltransferase n=1 Tax=Erysipelothrix sp. HDW6A TaxID=2714928 RepID=UPI00140A73AB|nr:glycerol-3-phosphate acyltransferase [Erysipelothrix sp. HDW6A]QIK56627.1 glycerol-3-phosphate acyltransferase [Erysipelothrix sp. HDW6A]